MKIEDNCVVRFHYSVTESDQALVESSRNREPLSVLIGHANVIPGLEAAMKGHEAGDKFAVTVTPDQAYGERREGAIQRVPRKHFKGAKVVPGMKMVLPTDNGQRAVTVQKVGISVVDVDMNHPMAGKTLSFDVEIIDVREASVEEKQHGHVHGDGGHQH